MANILLRDIAAFQGKCSVLNDTVHKFVEYSSTTATSISQVSLKILRDALSKWFVIYCALNDEFMFLVSGDTSCSRHAGEKHLYQHTRAASSERHNGDWLNRCSSDGINYQILQINPDQLEKTRVENALNAFGGADSHLQNDCMTLFKAQFTHIVSALKTCGATDLPEKTAHGVERLAFRLRRGNDILNFSIARQNSIRKVSWSDLLHVLQTGGARRRSNKIIDEDDDDDNNKRDRYTVAAVGAACSHCSKVSRAAPDAQNAEDTTVISINKVKRSLGVDPFELSRNRQALEKESFCDNPSAAHEHNDAKERRKREDEARAVAESPNTEQQVYAPAGAGLGVLRFKSFEGMATCSTIRRKVSMSGDRGGVSGVLDDGTDEWCRDVSGDVLEGKELKEDISWQQRSERRLRASRVSIEPSVIVVKGIVEYGTDDDVEQRQLTFSVKIICHTGAYLFADTIFEAIVRQLWTDTAETCTYLPEHMVIVQGSGARNIVRAGGVCLASQLTDPSNRIEVVCDSRSDIVSALKQIRQYWVASSTQNSSLPAAHPPPYTILRYLSSFMTGGGEAERHVMVDPTMLPMSPSTCRQYLSTLCNILTSIDNMISRVTLRSIPWRIEGDVVCRLLGSSKSLCLDMCCDSSVLTSAGLCMANNVTRDALSLSLLEEFSVVSCRFDKLDDAAQQAVSVLLDCLFDPSIAPRVRLVEFSNCFVTASEAHLFCSCLFRVLLKHSHSARQYTAKIIIKGIPSEWRIMEIFQHLPQGGAILVDATPGVLCDYV